jgi:hypothetical protein
MLHMGKRLPRRYYSEADKALMWHRWPGSVNNPARFAMPSRQSCASLAAAGALFGLYSADSDNEKGAEMQKTLTLLCVLVSLAIGSPVTQAAATKDDVIGLIRISGALVACGYTDEGVKAGESAIKVLPLFDLNDKSPEVLEAFVRGKQIVDNGEATCKQIVDHAKAAGIFDLE